ncbi:MAG: hypothetical protein HQ521_03280 [Bacteroidetes bacterium]|nr:hypothetical protein [Bacteroidota bacterium]
MKNQIIPDSDYIARRIKKGALDEDGNPTAAAFILRENIDKYLSIDWVNWLNKTSKDEEILELIEIYKIRGFKKNNGCGISYLNTGTIKRNVLKKSVQKKLLNIKHLRDHTSYSGIFNYLVSDIDIPEFIAQSVETTKII